MRTIYLSLLTLCICPLAQAQTETAASQSQELIPQQLLGLIHAPEVHQELKFSAAQIQQLERFFERIDGHWFRARILPPQKRIATIASLEQQLRQWFGRNASPQQLERLQQLEYRAQGIRMLLRNDLSRQLNMDSTQRAKFAELARKTNEATEELRQATMRNEVTDELKNAVLKANQDEQAALKTVMRPEQMQQLAKILAEPFDTSKLKRIYPMAPELVPVEHWINASKALSLKELRGKVVLVHFYAFQCHNCHANFGHYSKWHEELEDQGVVVIGIQTPETSREEDPNEVRAAAKERGLEFPILVDIQKKNWSAWANTMWPTVYVIDKQGYIRHWWQGELNWKGATGDQTIQNLVNQLLAEDV